MKKIVYILLMFLILAAVSQASLSYGKDNYQKNLRHQGRGYGNNDPIYLFIEEIEDILDGTTGFTYDNPLYVVPNSTRPAVGTEKEGLICYDADDDNLYVYADGQWVDLTATAGAGTVTDLDTAYNGGNAIDVDGSAVTLTVSDTDNNAALALVQNDTTNNPNTLTISNTGTGYDILGSASSWHIHPDGAASFYTGTFDTVTSNDFTANGTIWSKDTLKLETGGLINNSTDSEFRFTESGEDIIFDMDAATNAVGLKSSTGVDELAMGAVDDLTGVGTIGFDAAASTITLTSTGDAQDLTIALAGANNSSLFLTSSGTAADAMGFSTSAGGMDFTVAGAAADEDMDFVTNTSINFTTTEAVANQFYVQTQGAVAGNAVNVTTTDGGILLAAAGAANGDVTVTAADDMALTATDDLALNGGSTGSLVTLGTTAFAQLITIGNETGASSLSLKAGTGNIAIDGVAATTITVGDAAQTGTMKYGESSATMELDLGTGTGAHTIHIGDGAGVQVNTLGSTNTTSATTVQSGTGDLSLTSTDAITMTSAGVFNIGANAVAQTITVGNETGASSLALKAGTGNITMDGVAATTITIGDAAQTGTMKFGESTAACEVDLGSGNSNKTVNLGTGTGVSTINIATGGTGAKTITVGDGASTGTITVASGSGGLLMNNNINNNTSINTGTSTGTVSVGNGAAGAITVDTAAGVSIDAATASNLTCAAGDMTLKSTAGSVVINGGEAVADAIQLTTNAGGVTVATNGAIANQFYVNAVGAIAGNAINLATTNGGIVLTTGGAANGDMLFTVGDDWTANVTGATAFTVDTFSLASTTGLDISSAGAISNATTVVATVGVQSTATAVTATDDGTGTGVIPANASFINVNADGDANHVITLPACVVGEKSTIYVGATGCELWGAAAGDKVNNVIVGATNEAALKAHTVYELTCIASDEWIMVAYDHLGAYEAPVAPDAR